MKLGLLYKVYWLHSGIYNGCIYWATVIIFQQWLSSDHLGVLSHRVAQIFLSVEAACAQDQELCEAHMIVVSCCLQGTDGTSRVCDTAAGWSGLCAVWSIWYIWSSVPVCQVFSQSNRIHMFNPV